MGLVYSMLTLRGNFRALPRIDRLWAAVQGSFVTPCSSGDARGFDPAVRVVVFFTSADDGPICIERGRADIYLGHRGTLRLLLIDQGERWLDNLSGPLAATPRSSGIVSSMVVATVREVRRD